MHDHHEHKHDNVFGSEAKTSEIKEKLVLGHMHEHNKQHVSELVALAVKIENEGLIDTAAIIRNAVQDYEIGNEKLAAALESLGDE